MKILLLIASLALSYFSFGQEKNSIANHSISADFGSYRNKYLFPITNITYQSPVFSKFNLKFSGRLRSYGTLYFLSNSAYDITPMLSYYTQSEKPTSLYFSGGIGLDTRIRLVNDERSFAVSSAEPLFALGIHSKVKKFHFQLPIWMRFYSNGNSLSILPEITFQVADRFTIYVRDELTRLSIPKLNSAELRHDIFVGTSFFF